MAITYKQIKSNMWEADCGGVTATGSTPMKAIQHAHAAWWEKNYDEVMNPEKINGSGS